MADLRTTEIINGTQSEKQMLFAKNLLEQSIQKQGLDQIGQYSTYQMLLTDHWKGMMGKMGNPWSWNKDNMKVRFTIGDFDGQVEVMEGKKKGFVAGIQSWDYYEKEASSFQTKVKDDQNIIFTLAAYHYFMELGPRLSKAPFIRYAGKDKLRDQEIEKVFVSWSNESSKAYDHYVLWIGKESGLIEATEFTTRDSPLPAPSSVYGSLQFEDYTEVNGTLIPFKQTAQLGRPKDNTAKYIHQINIQQFAWDSFPASSIRPFSELKTIGDDKPGS